MIRALSLMLSCSDIVAGLAVVTLCYHLTIEIAHGSEFDFRTASPCPSWYGRVTPAAEMLIRTYLGDKVNLLSENTSRISNGVFTLDAVRNIV